MKKVIIITRWFLQFLLASVFSHLALWYSIYFASGPSMGDKVCAAFIAMPIGIFAGVVIGDVTIYITHRLSILALITTLFLAFAATYGIFSLIHLMAKVSWYMDLAFTIPQPMNRIITLGIIIIPPLVGYNVVSHLVRKHKFAHKEKTISVVK